MDHTREAFADTLSSGNTERVNRAIDEIEDIELEERAALFDECFEMCRELYETEDGYQRQSVIRFAAGLYPRLAYRTIGSDLTDEALPGEWTLDEIATHRERLRDLYLDALRDDDGRVRRAAAKAIKELALTAEMLDAADELRSIMDDLEALAEECEASKRKHVEEAYENVAFHAEKPFSLLPDGLRDVLEKKGPIDQE
ncbi:hypothetical protein [Halorubrum laminariae]|uniref:HEAT repeat domain-containing protein n=1 Tax=Halorubrum laminariae TaxID=1433523 RepID=A0ABD6C1D9_9EURY|nr:hypothetical protein [Halorubrum laminariae]